MPKVYFLASKGRKIEPRDPAGKAVVEYIRDTKGPVNSNECKHMIPSVLNPEEILNSLERAGFLYSEDGESGSTLRAW